MLVRGLDLPPHWLPRKYLLNFLGSFTIFLTELSHETRNNTDRDENIKHRKYFASISLRRKISISNRRRSHKGEVETIEVTSSFDKMIKKCPRDKYKESAKCLIFESEERAKNIFQNFHSGIVVKKYVCHAHKLDEKMIFLIYLYNIFRASFCFLLYYFCFEVMLSLVATPIGNLEDITLRALRVLREADLVVCEDTRHSGSLLKHYEISKPLKSFHSHSTREDAAKIVTEAKEKNVAYISDAGMPWISDPAYLLVQEAIAEEVRIEVIPGANALLTGLIGSGLHMHDFRFLGFLPLKKGRQTLLKSLSDKDYTVVIYESPHRITKTLTDLANFLGEQTWACIARELTKIHETYHRGTLAELSELAQKGAFRGEIVLIF